MEHYYISKLEMILAGQLKEKESENYKSTNDIDILESLLRQSPENLKQTIDLLYAQIEEREKIKHKTLYELQDQIMKVQYLISRASYGYERKELRGHVPDSFLKVLYTSRRTRHVSP